MRTYELVLVLRPNLTDAIRKKVLDTIKGWLKPVRNASQSDAGGEVKIEKEEVLGLKDLQFPIKKEKSGFFSILNLSTEKTIPMDFEKKLLELENVIRHLLIRKK